MTKRENLIRLLKKQGYDEVPYEFVMCPSLVESYKKNEGSNIPYQDYFDMSWRYLPDLLPDQRGREQFVRYHTEHKLDPKTEIDEWGVGHRATPNSMHMTQMFCPLRKAESVEEIEAYPLPTYSEDGNPMLKEQVKAIKERGVATVGTMQCTVWETSWYIRGMEELMMDMLTEDPIAEILLDRVTQMSISRACIYANSGVDILFVGDDIGMQRTLLMSEDMYTTWIKPRIKMVIDAAKAINPNIIIFYHSCGYIEPIIPHLIDVGVEVLNPIQPECMDFQKIWEMYGDKLSFHGTIGTQSTMPFGTPEEVKAEVKKNLDLVGEKGGLFIAPTHLLEPEVPWENIKAYVEACREYKCEKV